MSSIYSTRRGKVLVKPIRRPTREELLEKEMQATGCDRHYAELNLQAQDRYMTSLFNRSAERRREGGGYDDS